MNDDPAALGGLIDIEPPVVPILHVLENAALNIAYSALLIIGLFLTSAFMLWKCYFSIKGKARRNISKLQKKFLAKEIAHHDVACQLSKVLQEYLDLRQSLKRADLPAELDAHKIRWESFTEQLSIACYSSVAQKQEPKKTSLLFDDADFWLRVWPSRK